MKVEGEHAYGKNTSQIIGYSMMLHLFFKFYILVITAFSIICAVLLSSVAQGSELSSVDLQKLIQSQNIESVDQLLKQLPKSFLEEYTLVYNSRSLQDASPLHPRALVYSKSGQTVIAFNGDSSQKGYFTLEVMEFDPHSESFQFQEIQFPAARNQPVHFSEKNPSKCLACHGQSPHPIYDNYPTWPGFYGVKNEIIGNSKDDLNFRNFVDAAQNAGERYSLLPNLDKVKIQSSGSIVPFEKALRSVPAGTTYLLQSSRSNNGSRPDNLGKLLLWYNYKRIHRELQSLSKFETIKYALLGALGKCAVSASITRFMPYSVNQAMLVQNNTYAEVSLRTQNTDQNYVALKANRITSWDPRQPDLDSNPQQWMQDVLKKIIPARYVLLSVGTDIQDWPMTFELSDSLGGDQGNASLLAGLLIDDVKKDTPELRGDVTVPALDFGYGPQAYSLPGLGQADCDALALKSLNAYQH